MRQILIPTLLSALLISQSSPVEDRLKIQTASMQVKKGSTKKAQPGFYLEIKRSYVRAYRGWQKKTIGLLRSRGFDAFNGDAKKQVSADNVFSIESIEKSSTPTLVISSVYIGPYPTEQEAERMIPQLLSALKPLIDHEKKNDGLHNRHLFLVGVVRVK